MKLYHVNYSLSGGEGYCSVNISKVTPENYADWIDKVIKHIQEHGDRLTPSTSIVVRSWVEIGDAVENKEGE